MAYELVETGRKVAALEALVSTLIIRAAEVDEGRVLQHACNDLHLQSQKGATVESRDAGAAALRYFDAAGIYPDD